MVEEWLDLNSAMKYVRVKSRSTFYRKFIEKGLRSYDLNPGGKYQTRRFKKEDIDQFMEGRGNKRHKNTRKYKRRHRNTQKSD